MKIIHTSDWHLGHRLYNYDRTDEEAHFFAQLADVVGKEQPDAMVVSGDIFHSGAPGNDVAKNFTDRLMAVCEKCPTMETVVIAGNHDSYSRLIVDEALWRRCRVHVFGMPAEDASGKADFARNVVPVEGKGLIAAVPFCHERNFPAVEDGETENRSKGYFKALADYARNAAGGLPTVLMAHLAVKAELDLRGHDANLFVGGEECVSAEELGGGYDYIALGHIHCPQDIKGVRKVARYCGTPRAIHFDEMYGHGVDVVTVEAGKEPDVRTVAFAPLHALETLGGKDGLPFEDALKVLAEAGFAADTYVRLNVSLGAGELTGPDWSERARKACEEKGLRFCVVNPIRRETEEEKAEAKAVLTMAELKELSNDEVLAILSSGRQPLTERQRALVKSLMEEVAE